LTWSLTTNLARRVQVPGTGWSSPIVWNDRTFKILARNPLEGLCKASPAIARGRIFIRSENSLFCIRNAQGK
jgi:hypothetical protein